jgi:hypothetical protein
MLKRLGLGLLKGLLVGGAIGAGLQLGLGWHGELVAGLLGYLLAMGVAGTTGIFAGKPPWQEGAWIEATLKGLAGVGVGALLYWVSSRWAALDVPFPGLAQAEPWTSLPAVFAPLVAAVYGSLVELDNTGEPAQGGAGKGGSGKGGAGAKAAKARVAVEDEDELTIDEPPTRGSAGKKRQA